MVAADGAGSGVRRRHAEAFGTRIEPGRNRYLWLGTPASFSTFTFGFVDTGSGMDLVPRLPVRRRHQHVHRGGAADHVDGAGLRPARHRGVPGHAARDLRPGPARRTAARRDGHGSSAPWQTFRRVTNERWHHGRIALVGDAAHTTHFAIGSGTRLALGDAMALADAVRDVERTDQLPAALAAYDVRRQREIRPWQDEATRSTTWFEDPVPRLEQGDDLRLGWSLWQRRSAAPGWRWYLHRATRPASLRRVRTSAGTVRRQVRAQRRALPVPIRPPRARPPTRRPRPLTAGPGGRGQHVPSHPGSEP